MPVGAAVGAGGRGGYVQAGGGSWEKQPVPGESQCAWLSKTHPGGPQLKDLHGVAPTAGSSRYSEQAPGTALFLGKSQRHEANHGPPAGIGLHCLTAMYPGHTTPVPGG